MFVFRDDFVNNKDNNKEEGLTEIKHYIIQ